MLMGGVGAVRLHRSADLGRGDLAGGGGQRQAFVAGGLNGAGLVHMDVAGLGAQDALPGFQRGGNHRQVGLGGPHKKMYGGIGGVAQRADLVGGCGAILVLPVAGGLLQVGLLQQIQDRLGGTLAVITLKTNHRKLSFRWHTVHYSTDG